MRGTRSRASSVAGLLAVAIGLAVVGCSDNPGIDPPSASFAFPSGLLLDPRVSSEPGPACEDDSACGDAQVCTSAGVCRDTARWLFVTNANSDLRYNSGSLLVVDLAAFWAEALDPETRNVLGAGSRLSEPGADWNVNSPACGSASGAGDWCRRVANQPQVVECLEERFVCAEASIHFGSFPGPAVAWDPNPDNDAATLLIPVRGDPSITYADLGGDPQGQPQIECGQSSDEDGARRCDDDHRLRFVRNDPDAPRIEREPFRVLVSPDPALPYAYVSHQGNPDLTVMALQGLSFLGDGRPAIVHQANLLEIANAVGNVQGGFGLAWRPCDVAAGNAPISTLECERPLVYASMRWIPQVRSLTTIDYDLPVCSEPPEDLDQIDPDLLLGYCEPQAEPLRYLSVGNLSTQGVPLAPSRPILADIGFSSDGNELYVVQSNPGALLRIDTSIGPDGNTVDVPAGQVEICAQGTTLAIYSGISTDGTASEYGIVTCYRSGEVFIVDLASLKVVGVSRAGIGPDAVAVDVGREVVYIANTLDATVSVLDMSPSRPTRFTEIARIGIQQPYVQ